MSILEVISTHVTLKKTGRNYSGLCPFHAEKSPSFTVNEDRGLFHCFGCGAGGSVFTFLMRAENLEFREAVEQLAKRVGIELPKADVDGPRHGLVAANEAAQEYFTASFKSARGGAAREYLASRGLSSPVLDLYGIGFCPPQGGLARHLVSRKIPPQAALQLGLVGRRGDGSFYDKLWGRVTFPIRDTGGRVIGFGGRAIGDQNPKYLNSPETLLFRKGEGLYGLYEARQAIRAAERVVIVEGYIDALALAQAEIPYVVASLGTALTVTQLRLARRFAPEVIAFFDGDGAGQKAAARAFAVCAETNVWGLGAFLPQGFDPDTYVRQHGRDAALAVIEHAIPLADFFLQSLAPGPTATVPERVRAAGRAAEVLTKVEDVTQFSILVQKAAQVLGVGEEVFRQRRVSGAPQKEKLVSNPPPYEQSYRPEEVTLVEVMALEKSVAEYVENTGILPCLESRELAAVGQKICEAWGGGAAVESLLDSFPARVGERIRSGFLGESAVAHADRMGIARDCVARILERDRRARIGALRSQVQQAEASGQRAPLESLRDQLRRRGDSGTSMH